MSSCLSYVNGSSQSIVEVKRLIEQNVGSIYLLDSGKFLPMVTRPARIDVKLWSTTADSYTPRYGVNAMQINDAFYLVTRILGSSSGIQTIDPFTINTVAAYLAKITSTSTTILATDFVSFTKLADNNWSVDLRIGLLIDTYVVNKPSNSYYINVNFAAAAGNRVTVMQIPGLTDPENPQNTDNVSLTLSIDTQGYGTLTLDQECAATIDMFYKYRYETGTSEFTEAIVQITVQAGQLYTDVVLNQGPAGQRNYEATQNTPIYTIETESWVQTAVTLNTPWD
jgi:hypothetical protein